MCGLIGYLGNKPSGVNIDKLNILGILNETRGTDSCGVTMDGEILKGVEGLKTYRDFVAFYDLVNPGYTTGVIGHTRKATFGVHSEANAHPFGFGTHKIRGIKDPVFEFVGVHNGTLLNHTDLANSGGIELIKEVIEEEEIEEEVNGKKIKKIKKTSKNVSKIDSEILLERLYRDKNFSVLSEYNGAAALIWQDIKKPNVMYFYHGKSKKDEYDDELVEERPLYYWKQNKNSMYVSSLIDSLYVIGGCQDTIGEFKHNVVYEVKDGNIAKAKKTTIDRSKNWKSKGYGSNYRNRHNYGNTSRNFHCANHKRSGNIQRPYSAKPVKELGAASQYLLNLELPIDKGLLQEKFDFNPNLNKGLTVCKQLRYWRNGHLADGVFAYIEGHGFLHLGPSQKFALGALKEQYAGKFFYNKEFHSDIPDNPKETFYFVPFPTNNVKKDALNYLYYMYDGIRMKTYSDWFNVTEAAKNPKNQINFDIVALSIAAAHPIVDVKSSNRTPGVYYNGLLAEDSFSFLGSKKLYKFKSGQVTDISYIPGQEPKELLDEIRPPFTTLESAARFLELSAKANGYVNLKEKDLQKELVSLDSVIDGLKADKDTVVRKVSDRIESLIDKTLVDAFAETKPNYVDTYDNLSQFISGSTKAELACNILTKLIKLENE